MDRKGKLGKGIEGEQITREGGKGEEMGRGE